MIKNNAIKKEVSCKPLFPIFNAAKQRNININKLLEGIPYELSYLLNKHERIEWRVWCKIIANLRPYFTYSDYEQIGKDFVKKQHYIEGYIFHFMFFSAGKIAKIAKGPFMKATKAMLDPMFSCFTPDLEILGKNKIRISMYLNPGYEQCPEWHYMSLGVMKELGSTVGLKSYRFDNILINQNVGSSIMTLEEDGFFTALKKWVRWLFNIRKAFVDLNESHEELLNNYNKLEESKKLLQKQTTQLRTAHEITKSIRQSLDLNKTLNAITSALVNEANFASAQIKLFKDAEGNNLNIEDYSGMYKANINPVIKPILINESKIGELIIYPDIETEIFECEELLNYLLPIINISIHDSLIFRMVTDYKNNLENKVEIRTAELKIAQNELSKTIDLLQAEQQVQNRFFTNISHEFRTPLTLILGPIKQITEQIKNEKIKDRLGVVYKNANRLLGLVNQLLDIAKLESQNMKLRTIPQNIVPLLRNLVLSFSSYAERKRIRLKLNLQENEIILYLDKDKFEKIITNVLSNSFKFTPEGGQIEVTINLLSRSVSPLLKTSGEADKRDFVEISILDTGIGIPKEKILKIFDRFYQVDGSHTKEGEGTGIGLSLTKELVELHKGRIEVESEEGKGTIVKIKIPLGIEHLKPDEICVNDKEEKDSDIRPELIYYEEIKKNKPDFDLITESNLSVELSDDETDKTRKPLILIIEDNSDVRNYIIDNLNKDYRVMEAIDGEDGWIKSIENLPELIVSDLMMPKMNGFQFCTRLKTDERTSHIPLIMLTAKATSQDKIAGFETGADDYIMKPFEPDELTARIKNLIEQRKRLHEYFQKKGIFELDQAEITSIDKKLLQNTFDAINKNISNPSFNVEMLAENLAISRYVLYKKIISLTGESPVELIRRIRLLKAAVLIENKFGNLSEIALEVGFNNPAYFSDCFKKQFGISPSQYHQKINSN